MISMSLLGFIGLVLVLTAFYATYALIKNGTSGKQPTPLDLPLTPEEPWQYKPKKVVDLADYNYDCTYDESCQRWQVTLTEQQQVVIDFIYREDIIRQGTTLKNALRELLPKMREKLKW